MNAMLFAPEAIYQEQCAFRIHVSEGRNGQGEVRLWGTECTVLSLCLKMQRVC